LYIHKYHSMMIMNKHIDKNIETDFNSINIVLN